MRDGTLDFQGPQLTEGIISFQALNESYNKICNALNMDCPALALFDSDLNLLENNEEYAGLFEVNGTSSCGGAGSVVPVHSSVCDLTSCVICQVLLPSFSPESRRHVQRRSKTFCRVDQQSKPRFIEVQAFPLPRNARLARTTDSKAKWLLRVDTLDSASMPLDISARRKIEMVLDALCSLRYSGNAFNSSAVSLVSRCRVYRALPSLTEKDLDAFIVGEKSFRLAGYLSRVAEDSNQGKADRNPRSEERDSTSSEERTADERNRAHLGIEVQAFNIFIEDHDKESGEPSLDYMQRFSDTLKPVLRTSEGSTIGVAAPWLHDLKADNEDLRRALGLDYPADSFLLVHDGALLGILAVDAEDAQRNQPSASNDPQNDSAPLSKAREEAVGPFATIVAQLLAEDWKQNDPKYYCAALDVIQSSYQMQSRLEESVRVGSTVDRISIPKRVLAHMLEKSAELFPDESTMSHVRLRRVAAGAKGESLDLWASTGEYGRISKFRKPLAHGNSVSAMVARSGFTIVANGRAEWGKDILEDMTPLEKQKLAKMQSFAVVPIGDPSDCKGVLSLQSTRDRAYSEAFVKDFLRTIALAMVPLLDSIRTEDKVEHNWRNGAGTFAHRVGNQLLRMLTKIPVNGNIDSPLEKLREIRAEMQGLHAGLSRAFEKAVYKRSELSRVSLPTFLRLIRHEFPELNCRFQDVTSEISQEAHFVEIDWMLWKDIILPELIINSRKAKHGDSEDLKVILHGIYEMHNKVPGLLFLYEDNGPGIPPTIIDKIFEVYHSFGSSRFGGHGIGLSDVRSQIEAQNGSIRVVDTGSRELGGALFEIWIPLHSQDNSEVSL